MEIQGKIIEVQPVVSGTSERTGREWSRQTAVLETQEQYSRQIAFDVTGADRIAHFALQVGDVVTIDFDIASRKYNDRWFTSVSAWGCTKQAVNAPQTLFPEPVAQSPTSQVSTQQSAPNVPEMQGDDLPF